MGPEAGDVVGRVAELWRHPVKSLQGERMGRLSLTPAGAVGDRRWAIISNETGRVLSAKSVAELLNGAARIEASDGAERLVIDHPGESLSQWLGRDVRLEEVSQDTAVSYEMTFDPPDDSSEYYEIPAPPASFLDLAAVHLLTTASVARAAEACPEIMWDRRRFRPTVYVDCDLDGFPEQEWVGRRLRIGGAVLSVDMETVRCAMPLRAQPAHLGEPGFERNADVFRTLDALHYNHLGIYCSVAEAGEVAVGDEVVVE